ncbi:PilT/PilU family type 4a pilus ATPase [Endozoicomonas sp. SM1973]|uniref:PilT/PilU family type 4a pilus ATPase n=1 Tax=Spartinivicinus marinus TaxID=2994442 RepID=A0A853HXJ3_9GAMM|nr:PilT/PilU family type 4a pilus ATPase [Spartinivicinus marinus]MCX4029505.1 PilT/PilU family type 4a pilus ATPase [Spartinivicinus marinus]NYZ65079.1 PilT/PilU family type 4a pilus ATPase [Spartinivicinus marinus]
MEWLDYLRYFAEQDGSDLFLTTGAPPSAKIHGHLQPIADRPLPPGRVEEIAYTIMDEEQRVAFEHKPEMNLAIAEQGIGRFRVNIFKQRNQVSMVVRAIKTEIPHYKDLGLPDILPKLIMQKRGLILFVGGTGSGKSTSLAALIDYRNSHSAGHIITIEDPVEFVHRHKQSIVNQREVGVDTNCYDDALENTLRQAPDVILIGEIRSQEQMEQAITFAETGHLCISTLHANNANQALDRIINFFPEERHKQLFLDLSLNLRGIISQRLIPTIDNKRCAAIEILLGTPRLCDLIKQGKVDEIKEVMMKSEAQGMQTFDTALYNLYKENKISLEEALKNADSKNNLRLRVNLESKSTESVDQTILKRVQSNKAKSTPTEEKQEASSIISNLTLEPLEEAKEDDDEV